MPLLYREETLKSEKGRTFPKVCMGCLWGTCWGRVGRHEGWSWESDLWKWVRWIVYFIRFTNEAGEIDKVYILWLNVTKPQNQAFEFLKNLVQMFFSLWKQWWHGIENCKILNIQTSTYERNLSSLILDFFLYLVIYH